MGYINITFDKMQQNRSAFAVAARRFCGSPRYDPAISGLERLADGPCIVAANHVSYLDGLIFTAVLPARFAFVIKQKMTHVPLTHYRVKACPFSPKEFSGDSRD